MERKRKNGGFALAELLVGMVILVTLLAAISTFLVPGVTSTKYAISQENSLSKARTTLNKIVDVVRYNPRTVTSPTSAGTAVNELSFQDEDSNVYEIEVTTGDSGKKSVTIMKNSVITETMAEGIAKSITFTLDTVNPNQVKIELTLNDNAYATSPDVKLTTMVKMENM